MLESVSTLLYKGRPRGFKLDCFNLLFPQEERIGVERAVQGGRSWASALLTQRLCSNAVVVIEKPRMVIPLYLGSVSSVV